MYESFILGILPIGLRCAFVGAEQHDENVTQSVVSPRSDSVECCNGVRCSVRQSTRSVWWLLLWMKHILLKNGESYILHQECIRTGG